MRVGVLDLQGDVREHLAILSEEGAASVRVRSIGDLETVDALVLPGGESTTVGLLLSEHGMLDPLRKRLADGLPAFGTCAGAILLAREIVGGDVPRLGVLDVVIHRNAYGRQVDSFEEDVDVTGVGTIHGIFIRAPIVEAVGPDVAVLAEHRGAPVVVRQDAVLAATFHPELAGEAGLHRYFLDEVCARP